MKVYKFGGTTLATAARRQQALSLLPSIASEKIIIVCSAMGRNGFPYATDTLASLVKEQVIPEDEYDRLVGQGEIISAILLAAEARRFGWKAKALSYRQIGIYASRKEGKTIIQRLDDRLMTTLLSHFDLLVVPGFVAQDEDGEMITLGRGGSDWTAVLVAKMLKISEVTLWKDVNGVYPIFPPVRGYLEAYRHLSYQEMLCLSEIGHLVIQKQAIDEALSSKIVIFIRGIDDQSEGTCISDIASKARLLGVTTKLNRVSIATFYPCAMLEEIQEWWQKSHIFIKESAIEENHLILKLATSQIPLARKILLENSDFKPLPK